MDGIRNHIFFSDPFSVDPNKNRVLKNFYTDLIAKLVSESLFFFNDDYYLDNIAILENKLSNLDYCIDLYPSVNASVDPDRNRLYIHLFSIVAAHNITMITGLLDLLSLPRVMSNQEIEAKAKEWINTFDNLQMVENFINTFGEKRDIPVILENSKIYAAWPSNLGNSDKYSVYAIEILKLMLLHELGHWQYAHFNSEMKFAYDKQALQLLQADLENYGISLRKEIISSWIHEIVADYIAILVYTKNNIISHKEKQCSKQCYIAIGLYYGLISLEELGSGLYKRISTTHPPVFIRQNIVQKLYSNFFSNILEISYEDFMNHEIQEWLMIQKYYAMIIETYWRKHHG